MAKIKPIRMWAFYGAGPVNGFGGAYQVGEKEGEIRSNGRIGQTFVGSTKAMMDFESNYFSALRSMYRFSIDRNLLTIGFGDGSKEMVFALIDLPQNQLFSVQPEGSNMQEVPK